MPALPTFRSRWTTYAGLSTALAGGVILKALCQRPNFFSAAVYLYQSSANLMIIGNFVFCTACSFLFFLGRLLYGPLRPIEIEQLYEKGWFAVTELCLAMTIFRGEIGPWFGVMFFSLLAGKVWGWIGEGRVEVLEQQPPRNPRLFHTRLAMSLALSVIFDLSMLEYVINQVLKMARPDMMVMFGFEFAVLSITSLSTATRYALNLIEIGVVRGQKQKRMEAIRTERVLNAVRQAREARETLEANTDSAEPQHALPEDPAEMARIAGEAAAQPIDEAEVEVEGWEAKGRYVFYLDLATDFWKLTVYISFFFILLAFYGLPLHIMRDVFLTCRSFVKRVGDFLRYRTATRDMNERYPDANEEEIRREDVCIICREDMRPYTPPAPGQSVDPVTERMRPKKLPCGHVLHFSCLRSWLERQQICPTCRATVVPTSQNVAAGGAGAAQPAAAARGAQPNAQPGRNGPRVYQLGPLRIGVGAARGNNMFEELEQQLANANPPPLPNGNANADGPQQYGFGIRWDGMRRRREPRQHRGTAQEQLEALERQMQRELDQLQGSIGELQALRNIQGQLNRVRMALQQQTQQQTQGLPQVPLRAQGVSSAFTTTPQNTIPAGSDQLPPGLTLPEGWSLMPLQQAQTLPHMTSTPMPQFQSPAGMPTAAAPIPIPPVLRPQAGMIPNPTMPINIPQPRPQQPQAPNTTVPTPQPSSQPPPSIAPRAERSNQPTQPNHHDAIHQRAHILAHANAMRIAHAHGNPSATISATGPSTSTTVRTSMTTSPRSSPVARPAQNGTASYSQSPPNNPISAAIASLPPQIQQAVRNGMPASDASNRTTAASTPSALPQWGSAATTTRPNAASNDVTTPPTAHDHHDDNSDDADDDDEEDEQDEHEHTNGMSNRNENDSDDSSSASGSSSSEPDQSRTQTQTKRHPTVEDSVEDPD